MSKSKGNMFAKGHNGVKKNYYRGKYRKRKSTLKLDIGEDVVFRSKAADVGRYSLYVGTVQSSGGGNNSYVVKSKVDAERQFTVTMSDNPKMIRDLVVSTNELEKGQTVLISWKVVTGFVEVVPAQVIEVVGEDYIWVKPADHNSLGCVKVHIHDVVKVTDDDQILDQNLNHVTVSHEEVNVLRLMLAASQHELDNIRLTYQDTLQKLEKQISNSTELARQKDKLTELYQESLTTINEYKEQLLEQTNLSQTANTLRDIIKSHANDLSKQHDQIVELEDTIKNLCNSFAEQEATIAALQKENIELKQQLKQTYTMQPDDCTMKGRQVGSKNKRLTSFFPLAIPNKDTPSSKAGRMTLKRRAEQLNQVLQKISAKENPTTEDVITTLAAYLRRFPEISIPACETAKISFSQDLNTKEVVDLKVLLKLPMKKLRDLRRFLKNHNIKIFPSERHIYDELKERQSMSPEVVEIGIRQLQKTAQGPLEGVAYARVKNLKEYLSDVITKQCQNDNLWTDPLFNDEVWLKVGGDKGGSSTKLVAQFVNQKAGNSADACNILAMFNGVDSYDNLSEVFSIYYRQLDELMAIKTIKVNGVEKPLRIFLFGDYEFLCKYLGHMGPSSSYPCLWCNISLHELRKSSGGNPHCPRVKETSWEPNANWAKSRTTEQYDTDHADAARHDGSRAITGHMFHSISRKSLFPLREEINHIVPPSLHILLGLVVRYFKLLELECRKLDRGSLEEGDLEKYAEWQAASEKAKTLELELTEAKSALEADEDLLKCFVRAKRGRDMNGLTSDPCSMPLCALASAVPPEIDRDNVQWIRCVQCGKGQEKGWYHAYCVGIKETEVDLPRYNNWTCQVCKEEISGPDDVLPFQQERVDSGKALVKEQAAAYQSAKKELDMVYNKICAGRGHYETLLNERLENDLHVKRQAYHSQCFVGNHCKSIVDNTETLLQDLPNGECKTKFQGLFGRLRKIFKLFKAEFLTPAEVNEVRFRCWELGYFFPKNFPEESIPPKLHILICHIPQLAFRWKTIGLLSEQGLEGIHACINSVDRVYATVRDKTEHMRLVFGNHQQRNATSKKGLAVSSKDVRKCIGTKSCKGRYKKLSPQKRACKDCGHVIDIVS